MSEAHCFLFAKGCKVNVELGNYSRSPHSLALTKFYKRAFHGRQQGENDGQEIMK